MSKALDRERSRAASNGGEAGIRRDDVVIPAQVADANCGSGGEAGIRRDDVVIPAQLADANCGSGGEAGIRTLGGHKPSLVFETSPFDRSGTSPVRSGATHTICGGIHTVKMQGNRNDETGMSGAGLRHTGCSAPPPLWWSTVTLLPTAHSSPRHRHCFVIRRWAFDICPAGAATLRPCSSGTRRSSWCAASAGARGPLPRTRSSRRGPSAAPRCARAPRDASAALPCGCPSG